MEDDEAIARLRQGDIAGLRHLVERYETRAARAAYLVLRDRALAEDVVQAAFIQVYERIGQFDPARPFGPWFLRSVVNRATRLAAREARIVPWEDAADALGVTDDGATLDEQLEALETGVAIWQALAQLTAEQRAVIVLRYYLGLSEAEMADRLATPPGTIKSRLNSAKRRLRVLLPPWLQRRAATYGEVQAAPVYDRPTVRE